MALTNDHAPPASLIHRATKGHVSFSVRDPMNRPMLAGAGPIRQAGRPSNRFAFFRHAPSAARVHPSRPAWRARVGQQGIEPRFAAVSRRFPPSRADSRGVQRRTRVAFHLWSQRVSRLHQCRGHLRFGIRIGAGEKRRDRSLGPRGLHGRDAYAARIASEDRGSCQTGRNAKGLPGEGLEYFRFHNAPSANGPNRAPGRARTGCRRGPRRARS